jgi:multidrug efflux pump subunit AcrA (membrane-fusion protein)
MHLVQTPPGLQVLARALFGVFVVLVLALIFVPWQQNIRGIGRVAALEPFDRIQTLEAPVDGRVRKAWVIEASRVKEGDRILEMVDNDPALLERLESQRLALASQIQSASVRVAVLDSQILALTRARELAISAAEDRVDVANAGVQSARYALEGALAAAEQAKLNCMRQEELLEEGLASTLEYEIADRVDREAKARVEQARQALAAARSDTDANRANQGQIDTKAQAEIESARAQRESAAVELAALEERTAQLATRIAQQNTQLITAPRDGTVFRLFAAPGAQLVKTGAPLVSLIPDTESRAVELWVDGQHVPLIEEGRPVRLQFEGWPAVQFAGWPSVAIGTFGGRVALVDPSDDGRGRFRLLIVPDTEDEAWPDPRFLRQGVRAKGFVLLDQVSLGFELWRQANGFPPTLSVGPQSGAPTPGSSDPGAEL